uniref:Sig3 n=1 Tax=Arundo donax TaxID=35708 RepID=A0A0A8ZTG0_ARUDO
MDGEIASAAGPASSTTRKMTRSNARRRACHASSANPYSSSLCSNGRWRMAGEWRGKGGIAKNWGRAAHQ